MFSTQIKMLERREYDRARRKLSESTPGHRGIARQFFLAVAFVVAANAPSWSQEDEAKHYSKEAMQQALQTRDQYDVYGLRFGVGKKRFSMT
nr:hypothetical protein [Rhizobium leguminosarum]